MKDGFLTLTDGTDTIIIGGAKIQVKHDNGIFHVYLNGKNVCSFTTFSECMAFIYGVENYVQTEKQNAN